MKTTRKSRAQRHIDKTYAIKFAMIKRNMWTKPKCTCHFSITKHERITNFSSYLDLCDFDVDFHYKNIYGEPVTIKLKEKTLLHLCR